MINPDNFADYIPRITPQWAAGFLDGEGCIRAQLREYELQLVVQITQRDPTPLVMLQARFGGSVSKCGSSSKRVYQLSWHGSGCEAFLLEVKDFVVVKRDLVDLALELCRFVGPRGSKIHAMMNHPKRLELVTKMQEIMKLNHSI